MTTDDITVRNITGVGATFTGVVTYEDVTNVDSIGVITARSGIQGIGIQSAGVNVAVGVITALNFIGAGNTFAVSGTTVDISIAGGGGAAGAGGTWGSNAVGIHTDKIVGINTTRLLDLQHQKVHYKFVVVSQSKKDYSHLIVI